MKKRITIITLLICTIIIFLYNSPLEYQFRERKKVSLLDNNRITLQSKLEEFNNHVLATEKNYNNDFLASYLNKHNKSNQNTKKSIATLNNLKVIFPLTKQGREFNKQIEQDYQKANQHLNEITEFNSLINSFNSQKNKEDQANFVQLQLIMNDFRRKNNIKHEKVHRTLNDKQIKLAYLTFDDGPSENSTKLVERLKANDINGTFFIVGSEANKEKNKNYLKDIIASGNAVGLHGYSHDFKKTSTRSILKSELEKTNSILNKYDYHTNLFRSPYGSPTLIKRDRDYFIDQGYYLWDWNVDTLDWENKTNASKVTEITIKQINNLKNKGDLVILYHEYHSSIYSMNGLVKKLKNDGYYFVKMNPDYYYSNYFEKPIY